MPPAGDERQRARHVREHGLRFDGGEPRGGHGTRPRYRAEHQFTQDPAQAEADPSYNSIVFAGDSTYGGSDGFNAGSTFKLFTLVDWIEKGHSLNENLNGRLGPVRT